MPASTKPAGRQHLYRLLRRWPCWRQQRLLHRQHLWGTASNGVIAVYIDANYKLGTMASSKRFKEEIEPMSKASDGLLALEPVTFRHKKQIDPLGKSQFGLGSRGRGQGES